MSDNIECTLSTFAVEGLIPSKIAIDYAVKVEQDEMSLEEAIEAIKRMYEGDNKK